MEKYIYSGGYFINIGSQIWEEWQNGTFFFKFNETERDNDWITLNDSSRNIWLSLPVKGGMCFYASGGASNWTKLYDISLEVPKKDTSSNLRSEILEQLKYWDGAYEGDKAKFDKEFISPKVLEDVRKKAAESGYTHTTCIGFQVRVLTLAAQKVFGEEKSKKIIKIIGTRAKGKAKERGAWVDASAHMNSRPLPGDIYLIYSGATFKHIGFVQSIVTNQDGTETWVTMDGGKGTSAKYSKEGVLLRQGSEKLSSDPIIYDPSTNELGNRSLAGWIDIDRLKP